MAKTKRAPGVEATLLVYDIPKRAKVRNPSYRLRRIGVRINKSNWVLPTGSIPYKLLDDIVTRTNGAASYHTVEFKTSETPKLLAMAAAALRNELKEAILRMKAKKAAADKVAQDDMDDLKSLRRYLAEVREARSRVEKLAEDFASAASAFGFELSRATVAQLRTEINAISLAAHNKAKVYVKMVEKAKGLGEYVYSVAKIDGIPPLILADYLEENGEDASAARRVFK